MTFALHHDLAIQRLAIGAERAPLLVIDSALAHPDALVDIAAGKPFGEVTSLYPGIRAKVPLTFQRFVLDELRGELVDTFAINGSSLRFTSCHFSLVTTPPDRLSYRQRIPHVDSLNSNELAFVLYLFKADFGGTAFYRHRKTGFEVVDQARIDEFSRYLEEERPAVERSAPGYINGNTEFYELLCRQEGAFNRMLVYRRTSLHSGDLRSDFMPSPDPRRGRLSINGFLA